VNFTATRREIRLIGGEVMFTVHHDPSRPFRVRVGSELIEDVGTQFNVRVSAQGTLVSVTEGQVLIVNTQDAFQSPSAPGRGPGGRSVSAPSHRPMTLVQYDEALISADPQTTTPRISRLSAAQMAVRVSWTHGLVTFVGQTLAEAVAEMNRYNRLRMEVVDPAIGGLRLGGSFKPTDPLSFAAGLERLGVKSDASELAGKRSGTIHLSSSRSTRGQMPPSRP